ncbi:hypothetical protein [Paenibacillus artemisiicola]|uniref:hypothetical protein n=1 Tax=Paenibacillus artemisiicola TaxID=1172618 RepID=UPI003B835B70
MQQTMIFAVSTTFFKWLLLGSAVGILSGTASAFFLISLDYVTDQRNLHPWLLFGLPLGGAFVSYLYMKLGKNSAKGNNLILEQIHEGNDTIPLRMAPFCFIRNISYASFGRVSGPRRDCHTDGRQLG